MARVGFTTDELNQFKRGNSAALSIVPAAAPDQTVTLTISLAGFTAGFGASSVPPPPPAAAPGAAESGDAAPEAAAPAQ